MFLLFVQSGHDGFVIDPNGRSFMGRLGADLKLCGKVRCMHEVVNVCYHMYMYIGSP